MATEREKMQAGQWYSCIDPELDDLRKVALAAVHEHNTMAPHDRGHISPKLQAVFGSVGPECRIETMFHCPYGFNIHLGTALYIEAAGQGAFGRQSAIYTGVHNVPNA